VGVCNDGEEAGGAADGAAGGAGMIMAGAASFHFTLCTLGKSG
jgi:hypothetical protein